MTPIEIGNRVVALGEIVEEQDRALVHAKAGDVGNVVYLEGPITTIRWERTGTAYGCIAGEFAVFAQA